MPELSTLNGIPYRNLSKENSSPLIRSGRDAFTCQRLYSCEWIDAFNFQLALRGLTKIDDTLTYFTRTAPDNFLWGGNGGQMVYPFVCQDVQQITPQGVLKTAAGVPDYSELEADDLLLVAADKAHYQIDYATVRYPLAADDETNEPVDAADADDPDDPTLPYNEWDRYCEWTREWGVETLNAPISSYKYVAYNQPLNNYVQFQSHVATITCRVHSLPMIPPAANTFAGTVNHKPFRIYLDQETNYFDFDAETLLFNPPGIEFGYQADGTVCFNMIYRFTYRPQGHNHFFYYPGNSASGTARRWSWQRIAIDITKPKADGSAPFYLRNFGYLWSPQTPVTPDQNTPPWSDGP